MKKFLLMFAVLAIGVLLYRVDGARADEGMYTFDNLPKKLLKEKYGFDVTEEWTRKMQLAAVRFSTGGSGSFISPSGLIMTNHHVGQDAVHKLSTAESDMVADGFVALRTDNELRCEDLEVDQLISITDVTDEIRKAVAEKSGKEAADARARAIAAIEERERQATGLVAKIEVFYGGDQYCVYRYKKYTDVRLVFSPEKAIASFGGDRDNFCFPRWCLDMALFRAYEDGKPVRSPVYFPWSRDGAADGELVFVSGNPGRTGRYETTAACRFFRDVLYPKQLTMIRNVLDGLYEYAARGHEEHRQALDEIATWENEWKRSLGYVDGLKQSAVFKRIEQRDADLVAAAKDRGGDVQAELEKIAKIYAGAGEILHRRLFTRLDGNLMKRALGVIEMAKNTDRPDGERMPEAKREGAEAALFAPIPIYKEMEAVSIMYVLRLAKRELAADDAFLTKVVAGRTPEEISAGIAKSRLDDKAYCKELIAGGMKAVEASDDAMLKLMLAAAPIMRDINERRKAEIADPLVAATTRLGELRRQVVGRNGAPDANFTLRLSFGVVKGYESGTTDVPPVTSVWGLYERSNTMGAKFPYNLPTTWVEAKGKIDLDTEFNFVSTCDIIGGNSGSPVLNRKAEVVGLIFDGNIQSLSNNYCYDEVQARSVSVHSNLIIEALRKVYDAGALADEIVGSRLMKR